jgi:hypothetical protein
MLLLVFEAYFWVALPGALSIMGVGISSTLWVASIVSEHFCIFDSQDEALRIQYWKVHYLL